MTSTKQILTNQINFPKVISKMMEEYLTFPKLDKYMIAKKNVIDQLKFISERTGYELRDSKTPLEYKSALKDVLDERNNTNTLDELYFQTYLSFLEDKPIDNFLKMNLCDKSMMYMAGIYQNLPEQTHSIELYITYIMRSNDRYINLFQNSKYEKRYLNY